MFSIAHQNINGFAAVVLSDDTTKTSATIVPVCGAILHAFEVMQHGRKVNIVEQYDGADDFKNNQENKGFKSAKLSPFVCRLKEGKYNFAQQEYVIEKFYLGKNALHGIIYDQPFTITETYADAESARIVLQFNYTGSDKGYPFHYECVVQYDLSEGNRLSLTTTIINVDEGCIPIADGWHPYFSFGGNINSLQLEFQSKEMIVFDNELIPTGTLAGYDEFCALKKIGDTFFDNCFTLNFDTCQPMLVLRDPASKLQLEVFTDRSYPYLQLYTPPHRQSLAIENLSAAPDAFNNMMGLKILAPGGQETFKTTYKITALI